MRKVAIVLLGLGGCLFAHPGRAQSDIHPLTRLGPHLVDAFADPRLLLHMGAVISTAALVEADIDYHVQRYFGQREQTLDPYTVPAVWLGYGVPVLLGGALLLDGYAERRSDTVAAGSAVLQATAIAVIYTSLLKALTGRPPPDPTDYPDLRAASRTFRFGLLRGGIHYGWPSGHLGVNTAAVTALAYYWPDRPAVTLAGAAYLAYLAFGVTAHEGATMHWFSDVVAGTCLGFALGSSVGRGFRRTMDSRSSITPLPTGSPGIGLTVNGTL